MSGPVIVTRAEPGASETMARLEAMGVTAIRSPMLELAALPGMTPDLTGIAHIVFTSANGVRFFADATDWRAGRAWCVGPSTADAARAAGFPDVHEGSGDAVALAGDMIAVLPAGTRGILHVANEAAAGDLVARLKAAGLGAQFLALYETRPARTLTPAAGTALASGPCYVLVHSARGAAAFAGVCADLGRVVVVAISAAAAAPLDGKGAAAIVTAAAPNEDALLEALATAGKGA
ncbi:MAG: uroporphyrinogen-III synthase [Hyphomonas sp.]|uniref:uroporphyrinogen-III synthase n=1 Tax=Hyphomonas sp. TaxID=87 RepID=UPI0035276F0D